MYSMTGPTISKKISTGFTLVEMVIAITILGIIGSISALIIDRTIDGYDATARRAKLHSSARLAIERIVREVRHALPNSICTFNGSNCDSSANRLYFLKTLDGAEYQTQTGNYTSGNPRAPLPISVTATSFDAISTDSLNANANDWVVVYNTNNTDIYTSTDRRKQINSITTKAVDASNNVSVLNFASAVSWPTNSPSRRFQIIEDNATLFYLSGSDLFRATSTFTSPNTPLGAQLLLENVAALSFSYVAGIQQRASVLTIDLTITIKNESVRIIHETHIQNAA